jgi:hypothetical protein
MTNRRKWEIRTIRSAISDGLSIDIVDTLQIVFGDFNFLSIQMSIDMIQNLSADSSHPVIFEPMNPMYRM